MRSSSLVLARAVVPTVMPDSLISRWPFWEYWGGTALPHSRTPSSLVQHLIPADADSGPSAAARKTSARV